MALECLFIDKIEKGKMIVLHPQANFYKCHSGKILQYKVNPCPYEGMKEIPKNAEGILFNHFEDNRRSCLNDECSGSINYGEPMFLRSLFGKIIFYNKDKVLKDLKNY